LVGKPKWKRHLGRSRWEDNITMDFKVLEWEGIDWIHLAQDRDQWQVLVTTVS
jgi:hypothetical protein